MMLSMSPSCSECRTRWFDHDNSTGNGDFEILSDLMNIYPGEICPQPIAIEVQTISGEPASYTSDTFLKSVKVNEIPRGRRGERLHLSPSSSLCCSYDATYGFACVNADQLSRSCEDYRVRFTCPKDFCEGVCLLLLWTEHSKVKINC